MKATLIMKNPSGNPYYVLQLEGNNEVTNDFKKLYEGELKIYPNKLSYGIINSEEKSEIEFIITIQEKISK